MDHDVVVGSGGLGYRSQNQGKSPNANVSVEQSGDCVFIGIVEVDVGDWFLLFDEVSDFGLEFEFFVFCNFGVDFGQGVKVNIL